MAVSANRLELLQIADAVAREKVIDREIVLAAMADAIQKAARSRYGSETNIRANFQSEVLESAEPVVVDFWAEWCGPCKMIAPSLEEISSELAGKVKVAKLNIDENPELAAQFGVRSIPTLAIFKGGEVADIKVGAAPKTALSAWISSAA